MLKNYLELNTFILNSYVSKSMSYGLRGWIKIVLTTLSVLRQDKIWLQVWNNLPIPLWSHFYRLFQARKDFPDYLMPLLCENMPIRKSLLFLLGNVINGFLYRTHSVMRILSTAVEEVRGMGCGPPPQGSHRWPGQDREYRAAFHEGSHSLELFPAPRSTILRQ